MEQHPEKILHDDGYDFFSVQEREQALYYLIEGKEE